MLETIDINKELFDLANDTLDVNNEELEDLNKSIDEENKSLGANTNLINVESALEKIRIKTVDAHIISMAENINILGLVSIEAGRAHVMYANLVAQGNRAAGKLASLKVSKSGVFSISDPGVSSSDSANISSAKSSFSALKDRLDFIDLPELKREIREAKEPIKNTTVNLNGNIEIKVDDFAGLDGDALKEKIEQTFNDALKELELEI